MLAVRTKHRRSSEFTQDSVLVAVRLPKNMRQTLIDMCGNEDLTLSQAIRRALRHELRSTGYIK